MIYNNLGIREIFLYDPSRESAVKIRHNSHCRNDSSKVEAKSEGLPDAFCIFLGQTEDSVNARDKGAEFFAPLFPAFIHRPKGRFSFTLGFRFLPRIPKAKYAFSITKQRKRGKKQ